MLIHPKIVEELIFLVGIAVALTLLSLRYEYINGNPVPILVFHNKPALFHGFLVALNFGFTASVMTMSLRAKSPTAARFCRRSAVACVAVAAGLLSYSALQLPSLSFRWSIGGCGNYKLQCKNWAFAQILTDSSLIMLLSVMKAESVMSDNAKCLAIDFQMFYTFN